MKKGKLLKRIIFIICIVVMTFTTSIFGEGTTDESTKVVFNIIPKPKIDIVLSKSRTKTNVDNFRTDITNALKNLNVDSSDIKVYDIQGQTVDMESSFTWQEDISSSIGNISITNNGQNVVMYGNSSNAGKNAIWIMPDQNQEQKFKFGYNIDFGDSFKAAGMLLRVKQTGNTLTGYALSFNKSGYDYYTIPGTNGAIWKFTYNINNHSSSMTKTLVKSLSISSSGTLEVSATDSEIKITGGGMSSTAVYTIPEDDQTIGNGFGFFSDHYSHGCSNIGGFTLTNINLEKAVVKSFNDVLREPEWRDGSYKFLVNIHDVKNDELESATARSELLTRLLNDDIHFLSWGQEKNRQQFQDLIKVNNNHGKFILNSSYNNSITQTATYIRDVIGSLTSSQTVVVNEPVSITVNPTGIDKNTIDADWPYGKWKVEHDYTYYENNIGQFADSGKYTSDLIKSFNKTGRYIITYQDFPITPKEIFVHRRPVAQINMQVSGTTVTLTSGSYDLDKRSENNGISEEEWKWKSDDSTTWNTGKLTTIDSNKTYVIQLRVKDHQETWSLPATKYITKASSALPVAIYNITNTTVTKYENIVINDSSYDPAGRDITNRLWEVYKNETKIYSGTTPKTSYLTEGLGTYTMYLTVTNSANAKSERFARTFEVVDDTIAPEVVAVPTSCDWSREQTVHVTFSDEGGSKFRGYKYAITDSQATPTTWKAEIAKAEDDIKITQEGNKYLHIVGYDKAGNASADRVLGIYKIDNSGPRITIEGDLTTQTTNHVVVTIKAEDLLSGTKSVTIDDKLIEDSTVELSKNGTYTIKAEDHLGNVSTETLNVSNIYKVCNAELNHMDYPSELETCPICDLIQGLEVTENEYTYNAIEQRVEYHNPQNATIIEYYNGEKTPVKNAGEYDYELKVKHNGVEYKTGKTGKLVINKKDININDIVASDRQYDGTNIVELSGGALAGIEEGDTVRHILPTTGTIENANIGKHFVTIPKVTLEGENAENYNLIQTEATTLQVTISPRRLTIDHLQATTRQYNKQAEVEITGGQVHNLLADNKDNIGFILHGGILRDVKKGTQIVDINTIELTNNDLNNYVLIQPDPIEAEITAKVLQMKEIKAENRKYNGTKEVKLSGGALVGVEQGDEVNFVLSELGTIAKADKGDYTVRIAEITLTGKDIDQYVLQQPSESDVTVKISEKDINIEDIVAEDRQYDGTNIVKLSGGALTGIERGDTVNFALPETGTTDSINIGDYFVTIPEITLHGADSLNYRLIQPTKTDVLVTISSRELTIDSLQATTRQYNKQAEVEITCGKLHNLLTDNRDNIGFILHGGILRDIRKGTQTVDINTVELTNNDLNNYVLIQPEPIKVEITAKVLQMKDIEVANRQYDGTTEVKLSGGALVGVEQGDEVNFVLPKTGNIADANIGEYTVKIEEIMLTCADAENYILQQPEEKDVTVKISEKDIRIEDIVAEDRRYDRTKEVAIRGGKLVGVNMKDEVSFVLPKTGTIENSDIGTWTVAIDEITLTGKDSKNYKLIQPEYGQTKVTISKPEQPLLRLEPFISKVNEEVTTGVENHMIRYGDKIELTIRVFNDGKGNGYAEKITSNIPEGLEFLESNETNKANKWKKQGKNIVVTEALNFESGMQNEIAKAEEKQIDYRDITLVLKVVQQEETSELLKNIVKVKQTDIRKETIDLTDDAKQELDIEVSYSDVIVKQEIDRIIVIANGEEKEYKMTGDNRDLAKLEINSEMFQAGTIKIIYKVTVTNVGNASAKVDKVVNYIPNKFKLERSNEWNRESSKEIVCKTFGEIKPGEVIEKELVIVSKPDDIGDLEGNKVVVFSRDDIDQRIKADGIQKEIEHTDLEGTNNMGMATVVLSVKTGSTTNYAAMGILLIITIISILLLILKKSNKNKTRKH